MALTLSRQNLIGKKIRDQLAAPNVWCMERLRLVSSRKPLRVSVSCSEWQQQLEAIDQLPKSQQKCAAQTLDAVIAQATTKASSEGREMLQ